MNQNNTLKPYTVHYRDFQNIRLENCFYAFDAYEARTLAMEFNKYINDHPKVKEPIKKSTRYITFPHGTASSLTIFPARPNDSGRLGQPDPRNP